MATERVDDIQALEASSTSSLQPVAPCQRSVEILARWEFENETPEEREEGLEALGKRTC